MPRRLPTGGVEVVGGSVGPVDRRQRLAAGGDGGSRPPRLVRRYCQ